MTDMHDERALLAGHSSKGTAATAAATPGNQWWRHALVVLVLLALTRVGLYFAGFVALLLVLSDLRRHPYTRLGASVAIGWWTFVWARGSVPPLIGLGLLAAATAAFVVAALQQRANRGALVRNAGYAIVAAVFAVLNVAPWGLRAPAFDKQSALTRAVTASRSDVAATHAQVIRTRERFDQRPLYLVLLFEPNRNAAKTTDGEPCFRREEVHVVDGLSGSVDEPRLVDRLMLAPSRYQLAEAREKDGNCLPLPRGTGKEIVPIPGR